MSFAIQRLNEGIRATLVAHFLALPVKDRCLRFGTALAPAVIAAYVDGIDFVRGAVFGVHDDRLALVGVAHMAIEDDLAEVALSVLPMHRGRGVGSALFKRAVAHARKRCIPRLFMLFRSENAPIMRIAQRFGMRIVAGSGEARAHLKLQAAPLSSIAVDTDEPVEFMQIGSDRLLHAQTHADAVGALPMTRNSSFPDRTGDPQHPTAKHSGQVASDSSMLAGVMLDNMPDFGTGGQAASGLVVPPIDTHWSRILYCDISKDGVEPWAQHALAANGFGDVASTDTASSARPTSYQLHQAARAHRSLTLGKIIVAAIQAVGAIARRAHARHRQRRQERDIYGTLQQLDDRTLRDLACAHRSFTLVEIIVAAIQAVARRARARHRQHRQAWDLYDGLQRLDDRTLRDLGLDRSEIRSVATELSGDAECDRVRTSRSFRALVEHDLAQDREFDDKSTRTE
jgi:GNAT superfamily N-acetyltransferase/uncharacterized protein YjiS (DUF1127 family)